MSIGPLRRLAGAVGLLALAPTALMLAVQHITAAEAAKRAIVTLVVVLAVARVVGWWLGLLAGSFERDGAGTPLPGGRRATDPDA